MSVREVTCSYCAGSGEVEKWETAWLVPASLAPDGMPIDHVNAADCSDEVKEWITNGLCDGVHPEWKAVPCPVCDGEGGYAVEYVTAKIF